MSTSDPIAPDRLEALLRGEAGADSRERRMGALLDELTVGEIAPPAELRARVRSLSATPAVAPSAARRLPRLSLGRPRRLVPVLGGGLAIAAVIAGVLITQTRPPAERVAEPNLKAADQELAPVVDSGSRDRKALQQPATTLAGPRPGAALGLRRAAARRAARTGLRGLASALGRQRRATLALDADGARHGSRARRRGRDRRLRHAERRQRQRPDRGARARGSRAGGAHPLLLSRHDHCSAGADPRSADRARPGEQPRPRAASPHRADQGQAALPDADGRGSGSARGATRGLPDRARERAAGHPRDPAASGIRALLARARHRSRYGGLAACAARAPSRTRPTTPSA